MMVDITDVLGAYTILGNPYVKKSNQRTVFNKGRPRRVDTPQYKRWHRDAIIQFDEILRLRKYKQPPINEPVNLQCNFFMGHSGRVDLSALYEGIQDVLVEMGILADDSYKIVASHDGSSVAVDKQKPRLEVIITKKEVQ